MILHPSFFDVEKKSENHDLAPKNLEENTAGLVAIEEEKEEAEEETTPLS